MPEVPQGPLHALRQGKYLHIQLHGARLEPGQVQRFVDKPGQLFRLPDDHVQVGLPFYRIIPGDLLDHLGVGPDHGQGGTHVVGNVGDQIPAQGLGIAEFRSRRVQSVGEVVQLRTGALGKVHPVIPAGQPQGPLGDLSDGAGQVGRQQKGQHRRHHQYHRRDQKKP